MDDDGSIDSFLWNQRKSSQKTKGIIEKLRKHVRETEREAFEIRQETERLKKVTAETRKVLERKHPRLLDSSIQHDNNYSSKRLSDIATLLNRIESDKKFPMSRSTQNLLPRLREKNTLTFSADESPLSDSSHVSSISSTSSESKHSVQNKLDKVENQEIKENCMSNSPTSYEPRYRKKKDSQRELNKMILTSSIHAEQKSKCSEPIPDEIHVKTQESRVVISEDPDKIVVMNEEPIYTEIPSTREDNELVSLESENIAKVQEKECITNVSIHSRFGSEENEEDVKLYSSESEETTPLHSEFPSKNKKANPMSSTSATTSDEDYKKVMSPPQTSSFNTKFSLKHKPIVESEIESQKDGISGPEDEDLLQDDDFWN